MSTLNLTGEKVRLVLLEKQEDIDVWSGWFRNLEYCRMLDTDPARLFSPASIKEWLEKEMDHYALFGIRKLDDDQLIGFVDLSGIDATARSAWTGIGIGESQHWGKGYGTDAMRLLLRYAFDTLNLHRVNLNVFEYNPRGYRSYIKCGFQEEGRVRQVLMKAGKRYDMIYMGILRGEWLALQER